jgi:hypothetical protein
MLLEKAGEGGGSDVTIKQLSVTENGTYSEEGTAYSPVIVNVPAPPIPDNAYLLNEVEGLPSDIATFSDGSNLPMPSLKVGIEPIQEGSGDPSPTNIRPISGWNGAEIIDDAEYGGYIDWNQMINIPPNDISTNINNVTVVDNRDGTFSISTTNIGASADTYPKPSSAQIIKDHIYFYSGTPKNGSLTTYRSYLAAAQIITSGYDTGEGVIYKGLATGNCNLYRYRISENTIIPTPIIFKPMCVDLTQAFGPTIAEYIYSLEEATTGAGVAYFKSIFYKDYYAYNTGTKTNASAVNEDAYGKYNIIFPSEAETVYGGTLDVVSGVLTVTHGYIASYNGETLPSTWISDRDVYAEGTTPTIGAEVCYELATPTTIQLTPTQVKSLLGSNNVWADTGDIIELEYFSKEV